MIQQSIAEMKRHFVTDALVQGRYYQENDYIINLRISDGLLHARVRGSERQIYDVYINLKEWPEQSAGCTCSRRVNCKHAAACLIEYQLQKNSRASIIHQQPEKLAELKQWLDSIPSILQHERSKKSNQDVLLYLVENSVQDKVTHLSFTLALAKKLKKGGFGKYRGISNLYPDIKLYCDKEDEAVLSEFFCRKDDLEEPSNITIKEFSAFEGILKTGRVFDYDNNAFTVGAPRSVDVQWLADANGEQHLYICDEQGNTIHPILLDVPIYMDTKTRKVHRLNCNYKVQELRHLINAPPVPVDKIESAREFLAKKYPNMPLPNLMNDRRITSVKPKVILKFYSYNFNERHHVPQGLEEVFTQLRKENRVLYYCIIEYEYEGYRIHEDSVQTSLFITKNSKMYEIVRQKEFEAEIQKKLDILLPARRPDQKELWTNIPFHKCRLLADYNTSSDAERFHRELFPRLRSEGLIIEVFHSLYHEILPFEHIEWYLEAQEGNQFFSCQLGILVDNQKVNIVPLIAQYIANHQDLALANEADDYLIILEVMKEKKIQLPLGRVRALINLILHYGVKQVIHEKTLELKRHQFLLLQEIEAATRATSARWQGQENLRKQLSQLQSKTVPPVKVPSGLKTSLRDYQHAGLNWLQFLREINFSGILADDMGLGKTVQTLAHLLLEKEQGRLKNAVLIIAPTSLVYNWLNEAKRFTPDLKVLVFHGADRHQDDFADYDIVISTYGLVQRDKMRFCDYTFYYLILDEAQFIKNSRTKTTQVIQQLQAQHRLCLSGTPLENHLGELWSLFNFLIPGLLGDVRQFRQQFRIPIEKEGDEFRQQILTARVRPFILRRTKMEVAKELPPKTEMTRMVQLVDKQRDLYEGIRMMMEKKVREAIATQGLGKSHIVLLDALLKLRQVCCDPRLVKLEEARMADGTSVKLEVLLELVDNLMEEGRRVLIFSQFTSMLELIKQAVKKQGYSYLTLTGSTQNRQELVDKFQDGNIPIFLISLKAGGTGLNLTKADTVIHYDPWWNPAVEDQATDRTHRIGQENPVFVYRLITEGTVEEVIMRLQDKKRRLVDGLLSPEAQGNFKFSEEDVNRFFSTLD